MRISDWSSDVGSSDLAPEVYNGIERGIFRAASFPYTYAFASYKIDEIANWHTTNLAPGANNCPTIVGIQAYEALPDQYKDLLAKAEPIAYQALQDASATADKKNRAAWDKRGLTAIVYSPEELKKFDELGAGPVWKAGVEGPGRERGRERGVQ